MRRIPRLDLTRLILTALRRSPTLLVLAAVVLFANGGVAFTAGNTTAESAAGTDVSTEISGFTITDVVYILDGSDPTVIDQVIFNAQSAASAAWPASLTTSVARFTSVSTEWFVCSDDAGGAASGLYGITCVTDGAANGGTFYDGVTASDRMTVLEATEFDSVLVQ